jgi:hypothetical protein
MSLRDVILYVARNAAEMRSVVESARTQTHKYGALKDAAVLMITAKVSAKEAAALVEAAAGAKNGVLAVAEDGVIGVKNPGWFSGYTEHGIDELLRRPVDIITTADLDVAKRAAEMRAARARSDVMVGVEEQVVMAAQTKLQTRGVGADGVHTNVVDTATPLNDERTFGIDPAVLEAGRGAGRATSPDAVRRSKPTGPRGHGQG